MKKQDTAVATCCGIPGCTKPAVDSAQIRGTDSRVGWCSQPHAGWLRLLADLGRLRDPSLQVRLLPDTRQAHGPGDLFSPPAPAHHH